MSYITAKTNVQNRNAEYKRRARDNGSVTCQIYIIRQDLAL